ncbi:RagB/SusD family nutrient uptake outer membrane protein [Hymenobacter wooponensis]|uniref:RagB/SusD family nutrient uptake outer membrane protein n=1 Tax=Hymenobacter wooponensis TaxID=1525360 RepID=A0A4Z0MJJ5_9BACT|nr:RagB/SusD family nutrient uptake outer membrane protein [Hymenobacter wooponensis]TGD79497.1 RagB/SusD family nutrient uptake outer membrane protein [Hymenobacter wooponensis]
MRKIFLTGSALALLLAASSCDKDILDENPQSILVPSFLSTPEGVQAGLTGVYSGLRNVFGNEEAEYMAVQGTDEWMRGFAATQGYEDYNPALLNSQNSAVTNQWAIIYRYINGANGVIQSAASVQGLAPTVLTQIVAEAKVLRAQYYFVLVQYFGDVPLSLKFVDAPTKDIARAPAADVYTAIIADLNDALGSIADRPAQPGRVSRATALHLLSKVYLTRATSKAKQADDYAKAAQYAKELIDDSNPNGTGAGTGVGAKYGKGLEADVADVFREGKENDKEVLMNVQFNTDPTFTGQDPFSPTGANQTSFFFRSRYDLLPNMVRDIPNGRPYGRFCPTPFLLDSYILPGESGKDLRSTDTRYNKWFTTVYRVNSTGTGAANGGRANAVLGDTAAWYTGRPLSATEKARIASRPNGPYTVIEPSGYSNLFSPNLNKFDDPTRTALNNPSDRPLIVYRLAETYLVAAEANMYLGNTSQAVRYINVVRERAGAAGKKAQMDITAAQLNIDFILDERSRELAGEQMRRFDLIRTGKLVERVKNLVPPAQNRTTFPAGPYGSDAAKNVKDFHVLLPIPQSEIDRTSGKIVQNQGYL